MSLMNEYLISFILGIIEGLTEFLPVSSTAHLRLAENAFEISLEDGYWKMYSIVIQLGAVLCLPVYFRAKIVDFIKSFCQKPSFHHPLSLTVLAFLITAIPSFFLARLIGKNLESLLIISLALIIGGVVMWVVDVLFSKEEKIKTRDMKDMTLQQALFIGACQVLAAVFPGTSRSMATIAAGQIAGMSRAAALEFSFFLSMPTMAAATGFALLKSFTGGDNPFSASMGAHEWVLLGIGFATSFIVAYLSVHWLMGWVRRRGFAPFALYRIVFGTFILLLYT